MLGQVKVSERGMAMAIQVCRFENGGCAIHRIPYRANHVASAWFDAMGNMMDAEWRRIDSRTTYHVARNGPAWQAIVEVSRPTLQALAAEDARVASRRRTLTDREVAANAPAYVDPDGNPHY